MKFVKKKYDVTDFISVFFGITVFLLIVGLDAVNPKNSEWLMANGMDTPTNFLGWEFFRHSPWQFPIGANPAYGMETGSSVVFSDSLPLLAIFFKALNPILPSEFQYQGMWLLSCFVLQAYYSNRLLGLFVKDHVTRAFGVLFFLILPIFLARVAIHNALTAQWMLIAGLYYYFSNYYSFRCRAILLFIASLVHAYLLVMVFSVFAADLLKRYLKKEEPIAKLGLHLSIAISICLFCMYLAGYFVLGDSVQAHSFRVVRTNLLFFIDPNLSGSRFLPDIPTTSLDNYSYMGLGVLLLLLICTVKAAKFLRITRLHMTVYFPIIFVASLLFIFSLSGEIGFGNTTILSYSLPWPLDSAFSTFRATSRFSWPSHYLIIFAAIICISKLFSTRTGRIVIGLALVLQVADLSKYINNFIERPIGSEKWKSPLISPVWNELASKYDQLTYFLPRNFSVGYSELSYLAAKNKMRINVGYFARVNGDRVAAARKALIDDVFSDKPLSPVLHVFGRADLWYLASRKASESDFVGIIDNRYVIAPKVGTCRVCLSHKYKFESLLGKTLTFDTQGKPRKYFIEGWSDPEKWGTWTVGSKSALFFKLNDVAVEDLTMKMHLRAYLPKNNPVQKVEVIANNVTVADIEFSSSKFRDEEIILPKEVVNARNGQLFITLIISNPTKPGHAKDSRLLGVGLKSISFQPQ